MPKRKGRDDGGGEHQGKGERRSARLRTRTRAGGATETAKDTDGDRTAGSSRTAAVEANASSSTVDDKPREAETSATKHSEKGANATLSASIEFTQVTIPDMERYRVDVDGGDVLYFPDFITPAESKEWYDALRALDTYNPTLKLYGREITQSRAIAAYAASPMAMKYSGAHITVHHPFPAALQAMRARVEARLGVKFNHVLLNRYDGGDVYIGRHSDTQDNGVIASVSLGAERTFVMTPRLPLRSAGIALSDARRRALEKRKPVKWILGDGSMMVMQGQTQDYWKHEIPREPAVKEGRISLTFRQLRN